MLSLKIFVFLSALVTIALTRELTKCEIQTNVTWEQVTYIMHASEAELCLIKCAYEEAGAIDAEGKINIDKMNESIDEWVKLSDEDKTEADKCLETLPPTKTCSDLRKVNKCIYKSQARNCEEEVGITWLEVSKDMRNPSEKGLCLIKCGYEAEGVLDNEGKIDMVKMNANIARWYNFSEKEKAEVNECFKTVPLVKSCADIKLINACIYKTKA